MNVEQMIREAATPTCGKVYPQVYTGDETEYAVFNYDEYPNVFANGKPNEIVYTIQLHWFLPLRKNPKAGKKAIKNALLVRGCTYPKVIDAGDNKSQHYVFEFEYTDGDV